MHGGGPVTMIVSACYNGQRNIPCPKHDLAFFRNAQIFMWQDVGGPVKEKYQYIAPFIYCIKNGHVLYIMGLAYRRCLTNLPWGWNWATSCDPVPRLLSFTVQSPASQSVVQALAASASSGAGACQKCRFSDSNPDLLYQNPHLHKTLGHLHSQRFWSALVYGFLCGQWLWSANWQYFRNLSWTHTCILS